MEDRLIEHGVHEGERVIKRVEERWKGGDKSRFYQSDESIPISKTFFKLLDEGYTNG